MATDLANAIGTRKSSGRLRFAGISLVAALAGATGCPDTEAKLSDFLDNTKAIRDIPPPKEDLGAMLADVSGTFILGLDPSVNPGLPLQFIVTGTFTPSPTGGSLNLEMQPLSLEPQQTTMPRLPVGDALIFNDIEVREDGSYDVDLGEVTVIGEANPITGSELVATLTMSGFIQDENFICGLVNGTLTSPAELSLDGSTFGAVRIESTEPADLPVPATPDFPIACP